MIFLRHISENDSLDFILKEPSTVARILFSSETSMASFLVIVHYVTSMVDTFH